MSEIDSAADPSPEAAPVPAAPAVALDTEPVPTAKCPKCGAENDVSGLPPFTKIACPACGAEMSVPAKFAHFLLLRRLGSGGMGMAFLAEDESLGRKVAVKVMQKSLGEDEKAFETFKNEAQNAARLNHPHVAQIYSFGREHGSPYLEMELVTGGDLGSFIANGTTLDPAFVLRVGLEIAEGLKAAEEAGLFHGDVKPDNILFDESMSAKLVDFGIASRSSQGKSDELWGTPYYIAPEKVQKKMNSARSDIYSLGATLYHAITGTPPYDGADPVEVIKARFKGPPPPIESVRPDVEPEVARIISRMMYNDLFMRYPNYNSLIGDLNKYLAGVSPIRKQGPKPSGRTQRAPGATGSLRPEGAAEQGGRSGKKRFVISKGQMEAAEARKEMEAASAAAGTGKKGRIKLKGRGAPSSEGESGAEGESSERTERKSGGGGGAKAVLIGILVFVALAIVGVAVWIGSMIAESNRTKAMVARYTQEIQEKEEEYVALDDQVKRQWNRMNGLEEDMSRQFARLDKLVFSATKTHWEVPDIEPPPPPPEPSADEGGDAAKADEAKSDAKSDAKAEEKPAEGKADEAKPEEEPPAKPRKARRSAVAEYMKFWGERRGYPVTQDEILALAKKDGVDAESWAREKLGGDWADEDGGEDAAGDAAPAAEPDGGASDVAAAPAPAEPALPANPLLPIIDEHVVPYAKAVRAASVECRRLYQESGEGAQFSPLRPGAQINAISAAREERIRAVEARQAKIARMKALGDDASRALQRLQQGIVKVEPKAKALLNKLEREKREAEAAAAEAAAAAAAQAEKDRLASIESEEIQRVKDTALRHQAAIDAFDYDGFQEKMRRMEKELTSEGAKEELEWTLRRADCVKDLRQWILDDVARNGRVLKGFRKYDLLGLSADRKRLQIAGKPEFPVADMTVGDWLVLVWHLLENRPADRLPVTTLVRGQQLFNAAVFCYLHGKGEFAPLERSRKLAAAAFQLKGSLETDAKRLIPVLATGDGGDEGGSAESSDGGASFD